MEKHDYVVLSLVLLFGILIVLLFTGASEAKYDAYGQAIIGAYPYGQRITPGTNPVACVETDDGANYYLRGTTYLSNNNLAYVRDYCRAYDSPTLVEFYCENGKIMSKDYACPYGCYYGTCRTKPTEVCGDNIVTGVEQCDGTNLNSATCKSLGYAGGTLTCKPKGSMDQCSFNKGQCVSLNVNTSITILNESMSPMNRNSMLITWTASQNMANYARYIRAVNLASGGGISIENTMNLIGTAGKYMWTIPSLPAGSYAIEIGVQPQGPNSMYARSAPFIIGTCGDGVINAGEQCDGTQLGSATCQSLGYSGGTLSCIAKSLLNQCVYNTAQCSKVTVSAAMTNPTLTTSTSAGSLAITWTASQNLANYARYIRALPIIARSNNQITTGTALIIDNGKNLLGTAGKYTWTVPSTVPKGDYVIEVGAQPQGQGAYARSAPFTIGTCGDNTVAGTEQCDGTNLASATCQSLGYTGGTLACMPKGSQNQCSYNTVQCKKLAVSIDKTIVNRSYSNAYVGGQITLNINWTASQNMANYARYIRAVQPNTDVSINIENTMTLLGTSGKKSWTVPATIPKGEYVIEIGVQRQGPASIYARSAPFKVI